MNKLILKRASVLTTSLGLGLVVGSCAPPKALVIEEAPVQQKKVVEPKVEPVAVPELPVTGLPDDGIRMPEMLNMPGEGEFRATNPALPKLPGEAGAVISRPPTDPPSRVKPQPQPAATE
jgi:hypothetical protein